MAIGSPVAADAALEPAAGAADVAAAGELAAGALVPDFPPLLLQAVNASSAAAREATAIRRLGRIVWGRYGIVVVLR
jgi:hypothetical protein